MMVKISDQLYLQSIDRPISIANMHRYTIEYVLMSTLNARFRKCKSEGAKKRLFEAIEQGNLTAKRPTFQDKINEMKMRDLVAMLSPAQKQALINAINEE